MQKKTSPHFSFCFSSIWVQRNGNIYYQRLHVTVPLISTSLFHQLINTLREKLAMTMLFHQENVKFIFTTLSNILLASNDLFPFNNILSITLRSRSVEMVHMKSRFVVFFSSLYFKVNCNILLFATKFDFFYLIN